MYLHLVDDRLLLPKTFYLLVSSSSTRCFIFLMVDQGDSFSEVDKIVHAECLGSSLRVYGTVLHGVQKALNSPGWESASQGVEEGFPPMSESRANHLPQGIF